MRTEVAKDKTGVKLLGVQAINPVNDREIPIFISDYVLVSYGTGAIMAVPAHDTRDWEFAKKFGLPIIEVVKGGMYRKKPLQTVRQEFMVKLRAVGWPLCRGGQGEDHQVAYGKSQRPR